AAQAAYLTAKLNLDRSVIRAPFSGVIGIAQVRQGALVNAGTTLINTISATNPMAVEFQVSENELPQILKLRSRSGNGGADDNISLSLGGGQLYGLHGKITTIDRAINPGTGTITVRAEFNNPDGYLLAGMRGILQLQSTSEQAEL